MPLERVSRGFLDLSMSFQINPLNKDLITLKNENAIARSLRNLVLTLPGERFFNENLGCNVGKVLFDNLDDISASVIRDQIRSTITLYEPRVQLIEVKVNPNYDNNEFNVEINYRIIGADVPAQSLEFVLQPTR